MSNFLTRLIDRHLDIGNTVRPRLRTRFASDPANATLPVNPAESVAAQWAESDSQHDTTPQTESASISVVNDDVRDPTISGSKSKSGKAPAHGPTEPRLRPSETEEKYIQKRKSDGDGPEVSKRPASERSTDHGGKHTRRRRRSKPASPERQAIREDESVADRPMPAGENNARKNIVAVVKPAGRQTAPRAEVHRHPMPEESDPARRRDSTAGQDGTNHRHRDRPPPYPTSYRKAVAESQSLLEPPPIRFDGQSEAVRKSSPGGASETEPVINVTIGRIEIRAVQDREHKEGARQAKPSGIMSLDQFLQRRTSGGNR